MIDDLVIGMAGSGGDGIVSAGESLISACAALGYNAMMTKSFPPDPQLAADDFADEPVSH